MEKKRENSEQKSFFGAATNVRFLPISKNNGEVHDVFD